MKIRNLEDKIDSRTSQIGCLVQGEPNPTETDGSTGILKSEPFTLNQALETTFTSYDHILSRLDALQCELGADNVEDNTVLHAARRNASQLSVFLISNCLSSLTKS